MENQDTLLAAIPVRLPEFWKLDSMPSGEIVIEAWDSQSETFLGAVSVSEERRTFALGAVTVKGKGSYSGRGWKTKLFDDAVQQLKDSIESMR